ncbi:MAG: hypothetical protein QM765_40535 [Myxococcales bacterium]
MAGFRLPCTIPDWCMNSSPSQTCSATGSRSSSGSAPREVRRLARLSPTGSEMSQSRPSVVAPACTRCAMFGWVMAWRALASAAKRATSAGSCTRSWRITSAMTWSDPRQGRAR